MRDLVRTLLILWSLLISLRVSAFGDFQAGASSIPFRLPDGISLGGYIQRFTFPWNESPYAHYFKASKSTHDPVRAKALVLVAGHQKVAFVSADLVAITPQIFDELSERLNNIGINSTNLFIAATHTHSGPGGFGKSWLWERLALDSYHEDIFYGLVDDIERSVRQANELVSPAIIKATAAQIPDVTYNRRKQPELDPTLTLLQFQKSSGEQIATLINFPIHATVLGPDNLELSADVIGSIERNVSIINGGEALFFNGAEGDVAPLAKTNDFSGSEELGLRIARETAKAGEKSSEMISPEIRIHSMQLSMGKPEFNIKACLNYSKAFREDPQLTAQGLPYVAKMSAISIGRYLFITVPGEVTAALGTEIKSFGTQNGYKTTSIIGLTNSYIGYVLLPQEYLRGGYEVCASFYGPSLASKVLAVAKTLAGEIK